MKKAILICLIIGVGYFISWYQDIWNKPVENIDELIGKNYEYAYKMYFYNEPDSKYTININQNLNEFDVGVIEKKGILTDSIVQVYTWKYVTHKKTIWVGRTDKLNMQIIGAIRYSNGVQF